MIMLLTCSNFPDELSENDELREFELSGSDCKIPLNLRSCELMSHWFRSVKPNLYYHTVNFSPLRTVAEIDLYFWLQLVIYVYL